jgi:hypothetical protein
MMDAKIKHLELIQAVISRLGGNSFLIKGWALTLVSALFALAAKDVNVKVVYVSYLPIIVFWFLDSFYLKKERKFRKLFDVIRMMPPEKIDFSMDISPYSGDVQGQWRTMGAMTLAPFYGSLLLVALVVSVILNLK